MTTPITKVNPETGGQELDYEALAALRQTAQADQAQAQTKTLQMEQGLLGGLDSIEVMGIRVGRAIAGGVGALVTSSLIDSRLLPTSDDNMRAFAKAIGAGIMVGVPAVRNFVGRPAAEAASLFLAFDAARTVLRLDEILDNLLGGIGLFGQGSGMRQDILPDAMQGVMSEQMILDREAAMVR